MNDNPTEVAAGLRRLADYIESRDAMAPTVIMTLGTAQDARTCAVQVADIAEHADSFTVTSKMIYPRVAFAGLSFDVMCREAVLREKEPHAFTKAEIIARGRDAETQLIEEPF